MKTFVIGDVHGCCEKLNNLLGKIEPDLKRDRLVMLGDYIDRGPDSCGVLHTIVKLQRDFGKEHVVLLRGNHEQMAVDFFRRGDTCFLWNGGEETLKSFARNNEDLERYIDFFEDLPFFFEDDHFIYVHGGIQPGVPLPEQSKHDLLWLREKFIFSPEREEKTVVFGHTPTFLIHGKYEPFVSTGRIGMDTGCVYGGYLSAIEIQEGRIVSLFREAQRSAA